MSQEGPQMCRYRIIYFVRVLLDWIVLSVEGSILDSSYGIRY
jgi:hypothetical protein